MDKQLIRQGYKKIKQNHVYVQATISKATETIDAQYRCELGHRLNKTKIIGHSYI